MPTIDIPDKICIKCGSIRWRVNPNTGYKRCTDCSNTNNRKNYKPGSYKIKYYKNVEKYRKISRDEQKKYRKSHKLEIYKAHNLYMDKQKEILGDLYIKNLLTKHNKDLSFKEIPQSLVELKRKQLLLKRQIENNGKD